MSSIYGSYAPRLEAIAAELERRIQTYTDETYARTGFRIYEHMLSRVKSEESMREKCSRKGVEPTPYNALRVMRDSIGIRIVCSFLDDIYAHVRQIKAFPDCRVVEEKDYVRQAKPNGYRSYHMILEITVPETDIEGNTPGHFYVEIQLRTIAMDSWAALEHKLKYKHHIPNEALIVSELKRVADELASCDVSMQTIRDLIQECAGAPPIGGASLLS